ncbi:MAG TPA: hypothetical protein PKI89_09625 [Tepidiformaceae bacterium]|nr:hypothetical protein [Tepidiformaceae bacterium]HNO66109.1 hypothetical protein [Tepidiformaceae bacterium]
MSAHPVADTTHQRVQIRIPGWLILLVLVITVGWWIGGRVTGGDSADEMDFPARVTRLDSSIENRVLSVTLLVEANGTFDPRTLAITIVLDDQSQLSAGIRDVREGAWHNRSSIITVDRLLPEGRTAIAIAIEGGNGGTTVALPGEAAR